MEKDVFDAWWPDAARQMRAALVRRGVRDADLDDAIQATAVRALLSGVTFVSNDHFTRWCMTTSKRVSIDAWRRTKREELGAIAQQRTSDIAERVIDRLDLDAVVAQINALPSAQRAAIIGIENAGGDRRAQLRLARAKHAAREKLRRVVDGTIAAFAGRFGLRLREFTESSAGVATAAGVAVALAFGVSAVAGDSSAPRAVAPRAATAVAAAPPAVARAGAPLAALQSVTPDARSAAPRAPRSGNRSVVPAFSIPLGQNADGSRRSIDAGPSDKDEPLACISSTLVTEGFCTDPPVPSIDETLGTDLL